MGSEPTGMSGWRGDQVYYGYDISDMLSADIEAERQAIINYKRHIEMIDDKYVKALLERILLDEQHHLEAFKRKGRSTVIRIDSEMKSVPLSCNPSWYLRPAD